MQFKLSNSANTLKASEIREILKLTEKPEIISFAGGLPAPEFFPASEIAAISTTILTTDGRAALQYSPTEGYLLLREIIAQKLMKNANTTATADNILITAGSQQGIDFCGKLFLNEGDYIVCENPSYLGAISVFNSHRARYLTIPMDDNGMIIEELEKILLSAKNSGKNIKFIYTIPDFQNPTGITMSIARRQRLVELAQEYQLPIIEDNPYGDITFTGARNPALKSFDREGWVIYLGSFSKTLCPGLRVGWICASAELIYKFVLLKQLTDLQCSTLAQREVAHYLNEYDLFKHVDTVIAAYKNRRDTMLAAMDKYFPHNITSTKPTGGLFTWVRLPVPLNTAEILLDALKENVAFVPGAPFFPKGGGHNFLRLNYSNMPEHKIEEGIQRLAHVFTRFM